MPPTDSASLIVARFLKANQYNRSYDAFITEAGLPESAGNFSKSDLTLEQLLEEKKTFDLSVRFEKLGIEGQNNSWNDQAPSVARPIEDLPGKSNVLSATIETFLDSDARARSFIIATSASCRLTVIDTPSCTVRSSIANLHDSPILCCVGLRQKIILSSSMSGQLLASRIDGTILDKRRDHSKFIVKVAVLSEPDHDVIVTSGWDDKICIYKSKDAQNFQFGDPTIINLTSKPEAILLTRHPEDGRPLIIVSRTDSNYLYYYTTEVEPRLLGKQNLAPHSNAWVAFTPSALAICPTDSTLLAVGTNSLPHMKLLVVRMLIPPYSQRNAPAPAATVRRSLLDDAPVSETQASQARAALAIAEKEAAAIQIHSNTMAPQTAYSTPAITWRPDASGVWINGDDGAIRGIETNTGKVKKTLRGHVDGSKVRCLCAGMVNEEEWVVSGGFDQQLIVWKVNE